VVSPSFHSDGLRAWQRLHSPEWTSDGLPISWAFGYSPDRPGGVPSRPGSTFGMVGMNGSAAYADIDSGVAVAVMRNRFAPAI